MAIAYRLGLMIALGCFASYVFAQEQDIVVTGKAPVLNAGEWKVYETLSPELRGRNVATRPVQNVCVGDESGLTALRKVLELQHGKGMMEKCTAVTLDFENGRLTGRRRCSTMAVDFSYRYSGRISEASFEIAETLDVQNRSGGRSSGRKTISGQLIGSCEPSARAADKSPGAATIPLTGPVPSSPEPVPSKTERPSPQPARTVTARETPRATAAAKPLTDLLISPVPLPDDANGSTNQDDIVVLARSFQKMKLSIRKVGRSERFCRATESSGDKKIDRIGCSVLLRCIERGFVEKQEMTICVNRRMDALFPRGRRD